MSSKIPTDLEILPIMLKVGIKSKYDLNNAGHPSALLHLDGFEAVKKHMLFGIGSLNL